MSDHQFSWNRHSCYTHIGCIWSWS